MNRTCEKSVCMERDALEEDHMHKWMTCAERDALAAHLRHSLLTLLLMCSGKHSINDIMDDDSALSMCTANGMQDMPGFLSS